MSGKLRSGAGIVYGALASLALCVILVLLLPSRLSNSGSAPHLEKPPRPTHHAQSPAPPAKTERPNIVFVVVDDLDFRSMKDLPGLKKIMADKGVAFSRAFVSDPLCCPSRSSILRGQYVHNHYVISTKPPQGGYEKFRHLESSTVATWLDGAGYRTGLVGKYLNGYDTTAVPPGWDEWHALMGNFYDPNNPYRLNEDGKEHAYPSNERNDTDLLSRKALSFVSHASAGRKPFFLYLAPNAPHTPPPVAPRHAQAFKRVKPPRVPSVTERDLSDKPRWLRREESGAATSSRALKNSYRQRLRSMLSVEDMMRALTRKLKSEGELDNTYIFFTSDNGYHLGEHSLGQGKRTPYEEDIRVPLYARGPGVPEGETLPQLTVNTDLAPTFADLAGAEAPGFVDGRSLAPLLSGKTTPWRSAVLVEGWRAGTLGRENGTIPTYQVLRTRDASYIKYETGEREIYRLDLDPYQLENRSRDTSPALIKQLDDRLKALRDCAGASCRAAENARADP